MFQIKIENQKVTNRILSQVTINRLYQTFVLEIASESYGLNNIEN